MFRYYLMLGWRGLRRNLILTTLMILTLAILMWLRQRSNSIVVPLIAHNILNFGNSFFRIS